MAARYPVECDAGIFPVSPQDPHARGVRFGAGRLPQRELIRQAGEGREELLQLRRNRPVVERHFQQEGGFHLLEYRLQLCAHFRREHIFLLRAIAFGGRGFGRILGRVRHGGMQAGFFLHPCGIFFQFRGCRSAVAYGCGDLPQVFYAHIPGGIYAFHTGLLLRSVTTYPCASSSTSPCTSAVAGWYPAKTKIPKVSPAAGGTR